MAAAYVLPGFNYLETDITNILLSIFWIAILGKKHNSCIFVRTTSQLTFSAFKHTELMIRQSF